VKQLREWDANSGREEVPELSRGDGVAVHRVVEMPRQKSELAGQPYVCESLLANHASSGLLSLVAEAYSHDLLLSALPRTDDQKRKTRHGTGGGLQEKQHSVVRDA
jgi:hypothetical protein